VRDNGRGMERNQLDRIFEPFVQVDRQRDALGGGLGLGLAIVSNLVQRHGGTIVAKSEGQGRGSCFTVELPTAPPPEEMVQPIPPRPPVDRAGVRVLVVDDNVDVAQLLCEALQLEGFQTAVEYDSRAALEKWRSFLPHAAILDVGLPQLDGYELARTVRARHGRLPLLIAATGYGQATDRLRAADAGFDCHFVKPVSIEDIVTTLDQRVVPGSPPGSPV
jgi:CheY-like chemotaxis protein